MSIRRCLLASAALALAFAAAGAAGATEFIALGDMPYGEDQVGSLKYIGKKIRDGGFPFVVHYGDVKAGSGPCSDAVLTQRRDVVYGLLPGRVFYTPGDNDWTDCDRDGSGGFDETERLAKLREIFFADADLPTDPDWHIARQGAAYPENVRWRYDDVQFVTLHIVGTDNGRHQILHSDTAAALAAVAARDEANLAWLAAAFDAAEQTGAKAVVVAMQADPDEIEHWPQRNRACTAQEPVDCNPYLSVLERLTARADAFDKPVLLIHGSTNRFCLDTGFGGWRARKLWRLNGPGDFVTIDAAVVRVDAEARVPFQVHGLLSGDSLPGCDRR